MGCLEGSTALVTGGAKGIGAATERQLTAKDAHVAFVYRVAESAVATLAAKFEALGRTTNLDILANNAGIGSDGQDASLKGGSVELFDAMMAVSARGPYLVTQAALPRLRDNGRIGNIVSIPGKVSQPFVPGAVMMLCREEARWVTGNVNEAARGLAV